MKRTTAPGSFGGRYVDFESSPGAPGTLLTAEDRNFVQEEIISPIEGIGLALSGSDEGQLYKAITKITLEKSKSLGEMFYLPSIKTPGSWNPATPDTYFPAICLTSINKYLDISETDWPTLVPYLRGLKTTYLDGLTGGTSNFTNNFSTILKLADGTVEVLFPAGQPGFFAANAIYEEFMIHGDFNNFRTITVNESINFGGGTVPPGEYPITAVAFTSTWKISFQSGVLGGGNSTQNINFSFYPHRVSDSTTTARLFTLKGLSLHGQGDPNGSFLLNARRRGYFQSHYHKLGAGPTVTTSATTTYGISNSLTQYFTSTSASIGGVKEPIENGSDLAGVPRTGKDTNSPLYGAHIYMHGGRYNG